MKRSCIAGDLLKADLAAADLAKAAKVASAAVKADLPMVDREGKVVSGVDRVPVAQADLAVLVVLGETWVNLPTNS